MFLQFDHINGPLGQLNLIQLLLPDFFYLHLFFLKAFFKHLVQWLLVVLDLLYFQAHCLKLLLLLLFFYLQLLQSLLDSFSPLFSSFFADDFFYLPLDSTFAVFLLDQLLGTLG